MLYEILKTSKLGASFAPDMYTALWAQKLARDGEVKTLSGAPPLSFQANGTPLLDYLISGNTVQSGTPTPDNPIMPHGTGERTGNLFDKSAPDKNTTGYIQSDGSIALSQNYYVSGYIDISDLSNVTISGMGTGINPAYCLYDANKQYVSGNKYNNTEMITVNITTEHYIRFSYRIANENTTMLNAGSTAIPYEPHGYKLNISSGGTTTPVYLGEVETTRKIRKYEFTGQEADLRMQPAITATDAIQLPTTQSDYKREPFICSHMPVTSSSSGTSTHGFYGQFLTLCFAKSMGLDTLEKVRTYLQAQYANDTPVTVWYVLATEETAVVNEPLMKIGDYADTVSKAQAGVEIPTARGTNTLDVLTDVKPSEVYIKYKE